MLHRLESSRARHHEEAALAGKPLAVVVDKGLHDGLQGGVGQGGLEAGEDLHERRELRAGRDVGETERKKVIAQGDFVHGIPVAVEEGDGGDGDPGLEDPRAWVSKSGSSESSVRIVPEASKRSSTSNDPGEEGSGPLVFQGEEIGAPLVAEDGEIGEAAGDEQGDVRSLALEQRVWCPASSRGGNPSEERAGRAACR